MAEPSPGESLGGVGGGRGGRRNGRPHVDTTETPHYVTDEVSLHHITTRRHTQHD